LKRKWASLLISQQIGLSARGLESSHSLKGLFLKVLPLSLSVPLLRRGNHFFQFRRAQRVPLVALAPIVIWRQAEAESSVLVKVD